MFIAMEWYYFMALPILLLVVWTAFFRLDAVLFFVVACTPLSINLMDTEFGGIGLYLPTEPILLGIVILFFFRLITGKSIDRRIFTHPVSLLIYVYLTWTFITSISSEYPLVSFKFLATRLWFIIPMYFIGVHLFSNKEHIKKYFMLYLFPLLAVIIYTFIRHAELGFSKQAGHWVMDPFFKDHTVYGAVLAMFFPVLAGLLLLRTRSNLLKALLYLGMLILVVGIIFSYTRAAWVSIAAAIALLALMLAKFRLHTILVGALALSALFWITKDDILIAMEKNDQDSSDNFIEHVESISNVSSDASNLERLNRWDAALSMFEERPILGWGPGTYQFAYAPFQLSQSETVISTNNADAGNAHSEYLGPLAEQGVFGMLLFLALFWAVARLGFKLFRETRSKEMRILGVSAFLGLFTYFVHGILNNYLDSDKASIPFWGFIAVMVAIDLYHKESTESTAQ